VTPNREEQRGAGQDACATHETYIIFFWASSGTVILVVPTSLISTVVVRSSPCRHHRGSSWIP